MKAQSLKEMFSGLEEVSFARAHRLQLLTSLQKVIVSVLDRFRGNVDLAIDQLLQMVKI